MVRSACARFQRSMTVGETGSSKARSAGAHIDDGIDTLIFRDGKIQVQTIHYTLQRT